MNRNPSQFLLHEQFDAQARRTPGRPALLCGEDSISYAGLQEQSDRAAAALRAAGIGPGCAVGLHAERSIPWVAGLLAVLKTDAAVVPLPPSYPQARLREILEFGRLDAVVDLAAAPLPEPLPGRRLRLEELVAAGGDGPATRSGSPDQPAFVLASSGSTGRPKLIVRSHRSFFHRLGWTWNQLPFADGEVCCQKAHLTTTHAVYELCEPLLRGVPTVIVPDAVVRDLEGFWDTVRSREVTRLLVVPSVLRASLDMPEFAPPPLRVVVLMGEYVPPGLAGRAIAAFPDGTVLCSIYGSTEASSTLLCDLRAAFRPGEELPLGTPLTPDVRALVLGEDLAPVASGEAGRLFMQGTPLFAGYFRDPDLTSSVLVDLPDGSGPAFDTRDQVRLRSDGSLEFLGRVDETVKVRGFRVDLPEVERTLLRHPGIRQAAVVVGGDAGSATLLAFYVPASVDRDDVYRELRKRLPDYMVPSVLEGVDAFPLTSSHKVDRVRLAREHAARTRATAEDRASLSDTERRVAAEWERVLGHGGFGPERSFFEAGGTSLTVFALVHRLRVAFGLDRDLLPEQTVYRTPTLAGLAARIDAIRTGGEAPAAGRTPLLVTLRAARAPDHPPFFVIASAGGTLGAYERLARELATPREIVGVRDPYVWGERDPAEGFDRWVSRYVESIRDRQPSGPYFIGAYSSAGAFGYEIARRLRAAGEDVDLLALIDPLALARRRGRRSFGWWALRATYLRPPLRALVRLAGRLRAPLVRWRVRRGTGLPAGFAPPDQEIRRLATEMTRDRGHLLSVAALFELNSGLPFALAERDFEGVEPEDYLGVFVAKVRSLMPEVDAESLERIVGQYELQIRAQHAFEPSRYDGRVLLVEPATPYAGLVAALLRPYLPGLRATTVPLGPPSDRTREITARFGALVAHYRSMRDDTFVRGLAEKLDPLLEPTGASRSG